MLKTRPGGGGKQRLLQIITSFSLIQIKGVCLFFVRITDTLLTATNMAQETFSGAYDCQHESILQAVRHQFASLFLPMLSNMADSGWGKLLQVTGSREGHRTRSEFLGRLATFVGALESAQESIDERILLVRPSDKRLDLSQVHTSGDYLTLAGSVEQLGQLENCVKVKNGNRLNIDKEAINSLD